MVSLLIPNQERSVCFSSMKNTYIINIMRSKFDRIIKPNNFNSSSGFPSVTKYKHSIKDLTFTNLELIRICKS